MRFGRTGSVLRAGLGLAMAAAASWAQTPAAATYGEGWVTEIRPRVSDDGTATSEDLVARYISDSASEQPMGEYAAAFPLRQTVMDVAYVKHGFFRAAAAGEYRFAVTFRPHDDGGATSRWTCWPHLDFIDGGNRLPVLPLETIEVEAGMPPATVKTLTSSLVAMSNGLSEIELDVQCNADERSRVEGFGAFLNAAHAGAGASSPWPTMVVSAKRPGEGGFSPLKKGEILHDRERFKDLAAAKAGATPVVALGRPNAVQALGLPSDLKPGWRVEVYGIAGDDDAWKLPPSAPSLGSFAAQPGSFSLNDHRKVGMSGQDGRIYIAESFFLALEDGRYTFAVVAVNPAADGNESDTCLAELTARDEAGGQVTLIAATEPNLRYSSGPEGISIAAIGGGQLRRGNRRVALRTACSSGARADVAASQLADVRFNIYVRGPGDNFMAPAGPNSFVHAVK